jgi:14-3-3 protein epsilon
LYFNVKRPQVLTGVDLSVEERNLLSVGYKNVIGALRASWRTLTADDSKFEDLIVDYKKQVENELKKACEDALDLLENTLVVNSKTKPAESRVFFLKMTGDYYRYLAEFLPNNDYDKKAAKYYQEAMTIAEASLQATDPIRLGLALNYSVCFYEILKDKKQACDMAKNAFDEAIKKLDDLDEASYKDSTLIMQLLRDNLTLWTNSDADGAGQDEN